MGAGGGKGWGSAFQVFPAAIAFQLGHMGRRGSLVDPLRAVAVCTLAGLAKLTHCVLVRSFVRAASSLAALKAPAWLSHIYAAESWSLHRRDWVRCVHPGDAKSTRSSCSDCSDGSNGLNLHVFWSPREGKHCTLNSVDIKMMHTPATQPLLQTDGVCIVKPDIAQQLQAVDALQARHLKVRLSAVIQPDLIFSKAGKSVAFLLTQTAASEGLRAR